MKYLILIALLVGLLLRTYHLNDRTLTWDEMETFLAANGIDYNVSFQPLDGFTSADFKNEKTFKNATRALIERDSGNGIVYLSALYPWLSIWGNSNFSLRSLSVVFSLLTIFIVYLLGSELFHEKGIGLWSAVIFACHELAVRYAQEARPYSMAVFFTATSVWLFFRIVTNSKQRSSFFLIFAYGISSAFAILSHYFSLFILLAQIIIAIIHVREIVIWRNLVTGAFLVAILVSFWIYFGGMEGLHFMADRNVNYEILSNLHPENTFYGKTSLLKVLGGFFQMITHNFGIGFQSIGLQVRYNSLFLLLPLVLLFLHRKYFSSIKLVFSSLLAFIFIIPILAIFLAFISGHIISFQILYLNFSVPFCCILIGALMEASFKKTHLVSNSFSILFIMVIMLSNYSNLFLKNEDKQGLKYKSMALKLEDMHPNVDTVRFNSLEHAYYLNLYFKRKDILQKVDPRLAPKDIP